MPLIVGGGLTWLPGVEVIAQTTLFNSQRKTVQWSSKRCVLTLEDRQQSVHIQLDGATIQSVLVRNEPMSTTMVTKIKRVARGGDETKNIVKNWTNATLIWNDSLLDIYLKRLQKSCSKTPPAPTPKQNTAPSGGARTIILQPLFD